MHAHVHVRLAFCRNVAQAWLTQVLMSFNEAIPWRKRAYARLNRATRRALFAARSWIRFVDEVDPPVVILASARSTVAPALAARNESRWEPIGVNGKAASY